jgi:hypothetical protein
MVGTTRSRVNFFMNKFKKLGFIEYNGGLKINDSLLSIVLRLVAAASSVCHTSARLISSAQPCAVTRPAPA